MAGLTLAALVPLVSRGSRNEEHILTFGRGLSSRLHIRDIDAQRLLMHAALHRRVRAVKHLHQRVIRACSHLVHEVWLLAILVQ
eukprot:301041-Pleurochrysis_carterae.AAC.2